MSEPFLFVSHVSEDRSPAADLVAELEQRGVQCWIAPRDVRPGKPYDDEIAEAIDDCVAMLLIFSEHCNESEYIRREITVAGEARKLIIPFRIENAQPKRGLRIRLADLHWIDGFIAREQAIDALVRSVSPTSTTRGDKDKSAALAAAGPRLSAGANSHGVRSAPGNEGAGQSGGRTADVAARAPTGSAGRANAETKPSTATASDASTEAEMELLALTEDEIVTEGWSEADCDRLRQAREGDAEAACQVGFIYSDRLSNPRRAAAWKLRAAHHGYAAATPIIGSMYERGAVFPQDFTRAVYWYRVGAEKGNQYAQTHLGMLLQHGKGVERDLAQAAHWYRRAADTGYESALCLLGELHERGLGVELDLAKAMRLYRQGLGTPVRPSGAIWMSRAPYLIGRFHEQGRGGKRDLHRAAAWYAKAGSGDAESKAALQRLQNDHGIIPEGGPYDAELREVAEEEVPAVGWPEEALAAFEKARRDDAEAQWTLGRLYRTGRLPSSAGPLHAAAWLFMAASNGHCKAQCELAEIFREGEGVLRDHEEAFRWDLMAAEQGDAAAQFRAGKAVSWGLRIGRSDDPEAAFAWYRRSADQGHWPAQEQLGQLYETGNGVKKDLRQATEWFMKAFTNGAGASIAVKLGRLFEQGVGVEQDLQQAVDWYARAGTPEGQDGLARLEWEHGVVPMAEQTTA